MCKEILLQDEFYVKCYEDNQLGYRKSEIYIAKIVHSGKFYSDKCLRVFYHGSKIYNHRREGTYNDIFISPFQQGDIFCIGSFKRIKL